MLDFNLIGEICCMKSRFILFNLSLLVAFQMNAQDGFITTGGDGMNSNSIEAFSIGLVVYTEISGAGGSANQGIQHAFEIYDISVNEVEEDLAIKVFPNPTRDQLIISTSKENQFEYSIYNASGAKIQNGYPEGHETRINAEEWPAGIYFLRIQYQSGSIKSYKIIKIKS